MTMAKLYFSGRPSGTQLPAFPVYPWSRNRVDIGREAATEFSQGRSARESLGIIISKEVVR